MLRWVRQSIPVCKGKVSVGTAQEINEQNLPVEGSGVFSGVLSCGSLRGAVTFSRLEQPNS